MKARSAAIQGGLAGLALVAAYVTWQREPEVTAPDSVVALDLGKSDVQAVRIQNPELTLEVQKRNDEVWVHSIAVPKPVPPASPLSVVPVAGLLGDGGTATHLPANPDAGVVAKSITPIRPQESPDARRVPGAASASGAAETPVATSWRRSCWRSSRRCARPAPWGSSRRRS